MKKPFMFFLGCFLLLTCINKNAFAGSVTLAQLGSSDWKSQNLSSDFYGAHMDYYNSVAIDLTDVDILSSTLMIAVNVYSCEVYLSGIEIGYRDNTENVPDMNAYYDDFEALTFNVNPYMFHKGVNILSVYAKSYVYPAYNSYLNVTLNADVVPTPEPATIILFGTGMLGFITRRKMNRKKSEV